MDFMMLILAAVGILLLISSAWMLNNFDRLLKASKSNPNFATICNVDPSSISNGRNYAIFTLLISILIFLVTGYLLYAQFSS